MFIFILYFFFFKQKTAYEMRISDWSSDVCSSDLGARDWRAHRLPYWRGSVSVAADFDDVYREQGPDAVRRALDAARWPMADEAPQGATSEADVVKFSATPFTLREPAAIPRRLFLYGFDLRSAQFSGPLAPWSGGQAPLQSGGVQTLATGT